jgi:hypothetical protein
LLFGLHWTSDSFAVPLSPESPVLKRLDELESGLTGAVADLRADILDEFSEVRELAQRGFTALFRIEQEKPESYCPSVFVLEPEGRTRWRERLVGQRVVLHLYCQSPGQWHPTVEGGRYDIDKPAEWLSKAAPHIRRLVSVLKYTAPVVGPWLTVAAPGFEEMFKNQLLLMNDLVEKLSNDIIDDPQHRYMEAIEKEGHSNRAIGARLREPAQLFGRCGPEAGLGWPEAHSHAGGSFPLAVRLPCSAVRAMSALSVALGNDGSGPISAPGLSLQTIQT